MAGCDAPVPAVLAVWAFAGLDPEPARYFTLSLAGSFLPAFSLVALAPARAPIARLVARRWVGLDVGSGRSRLFSVTFVAERLVVLDGFLLDPVALELLRVSEGSMIAVTTVLGAFAVG